MKLLSRVVGPADFAVGDDETAASRLHELTFGITSDPLTQFACAFSALIHDVGEYPRKQAISRCS